MVSIFSGLFWGLLVIFEALGLTIFRPFVGIDDFSLGFWKANPRRQKLSQESLRFSVFFFF